MTTLSKRVKRETLAAYQGRALIVTLDPSGGGTISIREKGRRRSFSLPVLTVYALAAKSAADEERRRKAQERAERKKARKIERAAFAR